MPSDIDLNSLLFNNSISSCLYKPGKLKCIDGRVSCEGAEFVGPSPEVCDGFDNDCDGEVDYTRGEPQISDGDLRYGCWHCEFGETRCFSQDLQCVGGVDPINMLPDSGLDTDCDGQTDEDAEPRICTNGCPVYRSATVVAGLHVPQAGDEDADPCNGKTMIAMV